MDIYILMATTFIISLIIFFMKFFYANKTKDKIMNYAELVNKFIVTGVIEKDDVYYYKEDEYAEELNSIFKFYQQNLETHTQYGIEECCFYYDKDSSINAAAIKYENQYLVRIQIGLINQGIDMFMNNTQLLEHTNLKKYSEFEPFLEIPNHILMYQNAIHFAFYHELGHLIQFTDLNQEFCQEQLDDDGSFNLSNHLTEMDADEFAGILIASHISQYFSRYKNIENSDKLLIHLLILTVASIILHILSFPSNRITLYYREKTHPHPVIRVLSVAFTIISHLKQLLSKHGVNIKINHVDVFKEALEVSQVIELNEWGTDLSTKFLESVKTEPLNILGYIEELRMERVNMENMSVNKRNKLLVEKE